jgi:branched-chain amino acid aminotransferase
MIPPIAPSVGRRSSLPETFPWAYRCGSLVPHEELTIHAESIAMRYALSAFEGVRGYVQQNRANSVRYFALDEHVERLQMTLQIIGLPPVPSGEVESAADKLLEVNNVAADCYLRIAVNATSLGTLKGTTEMELFASLQPMGRKPWVESGGGISVMISSRRKPTDDIFPQRAKVICNYGGPRLAYLEARTRGFDDVILTTGEGMLSEAPTANLFLVLDDSIMTPRLSDAILPGITRRHLIDLGQQLGFSVEERGLSPADAYRAREAFLCGTGLELSPIARIDDYFLPNDKPVIASLAKAYFDRTRGSVGGRA